MRSALWTLMAAGLLLAAPMRPALAQATRVVHGMVSDTSGAPLPDAIVAVVGTERASATTTSAAGRFVLRLAGAPRVVAARIGFRPETLAVDGGDLAFALRPAALTIDPLIVQADRSFSTASAAYVSQLEIALRPRESSQELLRLVPGLVIAQHAGGGKAEQIFLRGFDADHGTDVAISVDGTPVNLVSHAHGQGYADLHWLMPEVVSGLDVRKGPYDAADGDFATAGAVSFTTLDRLENRDASLAARAGAFGTAHVTALAPFGGDADHAGGYLAAAVHRTDGPFEHPQGYQRLNLFGKFTSAVGAAAELAVTASGFGAGWNASGQIPSRAVAQGVIDRFGSIDPSEGGRTERDELSVALRSSEQGVDAWEIRTYAVRYRLTLYSNFTFFLQDTLNGDGIAQLDRRTMLGVRASRSHADALFGHPGRFQLGLESRNDWNELTLAHQAHRVILGTRVHDRILEDALSGWARQDLDLTHALRLEAGVRADAIRFDVRDLLPVIDSTGAHVSGQRWLALVSPKLELALTPAAGTTLYADAAGGFHSNDARDVILSGGHSVLPRAWGAEIGARRSWSTGSVAASLWGLDLASELVYAGDDGTTSAIGRTRRLGADVDARARALRWFWVDADLSLAHGRLRDARAGSDFIPLAPTLVGTLGLTARDLGRFSGGVRVRRTGSRPANEQNTVRARGATLAEIFGAWEFARAEVRFSVDNLFNVAWNEAQFDTRSRLPGEPSSGVDELHFTPGSPRSVQAGIRYRF